MNFADQKTQDNESSSCCQNRGDFTTKEEYSEFLKSDAWRSFSNDLKCKRQNKCELCESPENLETHHIIYDNDLMNEKNCKVLCDRCHKCTERMISRFKQNLLRSFILTRQQEEKLFSQSILDYYQNSFYAPNTKATANYFDMKQYSVIKSFMKYQINLRFPFIETQYNPVRTTDIIFTGDLHTVVQKWRDDWIKDALGDGAPEYSVRKHFRMSANGWYKAMKRIYESG